MDRNISEYIRSSSRNKLIFSQKAIKPFDYLDLGVKLAAMLKLHSGSSNISMTALDELDGILNNNLVKDESIGSYLAIKNLGILLEAELKIDLVQILDKYSSSNILFVQWDGEIEERNLYFLSKEKGQKIDIKNLSHIVI